MPKISVTFDISPATATTCGDGSGAFCPHCSTVTGRHGLVLHGAWPLRCAVFDKKLTTDTGDERGWVLRLPECIAAEERDSAPGEAAIAVWRDDSPPAFTAETPSGSHAPWWFSVGGKAFGPYFTRSDVAAVAKALAAITEEPK